MTKVEGELKKALKTAEVVEAGEMPKQELTSNELTIIANVLSQVNVPVKDAPPFLALINKVTAMVERER